MNKYGAGSFSIIIFYGQRRVEKAFDIRNKDKIGGENRTKKE